MTNAPRSNVRKADLPMLFEPNPPPSRRLSRKFLDYVGQWREHFFLKWKRRLSSEEEKRQASRAVDDLIALGLLTEFIRCRDQFALPPFEEIVTTNNSRSVHTLCAALHARASNVLIQAIFDPLQFSPTPEIPFDLAQSRFSDRIVNAGCKLFGPHLPFSLFGDFHQLCLARPIGTWQGKQARKNTARYAKGAHYTPSPLVDYLVSRLLAEAISDCNEDQGRRLRILDPSCGCGTFLIAAFRYILFSTAKKHPSGGSETLPSLQKALDIIETSIFGTDIDQHAVEWTQRLLLLSLWDTYRTSPAICSQAQDLRIPDISSNFACVDFLAQPVDAGSDLPVPFRKGADLIIGGPPFIRVQQLHKMQAAQLEKYKQDFETARSGQFDLYMLFIERSLHLLKDRGWLGFSVSNTFLRSVSGGMLRELIGRQAAMSEIVEFEDPKIYPDAITQIALLSLRKTRQPMRCRHVWIKGQGNLRRNLETLTQSDSPQTSQIETRNLSACACRSRNWKLQSLEEEQTLTQIQAAHPALGDLPIKIRQGISTGADDVFLLRSIRQDFSEHQIVEQRKSGRRFRIEAAALRPLVRGRDIKGYTRPKPRSVCLFPYDDNGCIFSEDRFFSDFPLAYQYVVAYRQILESRKLPNNTPWYSLRSSHPERTIRTPKLIASVIDSGCGFTLDDDDRFLCNGSVVCLFPDQITFDPYLLLGILNSKTFWMFIQHRSPTMGRGQHVYRTAVLKTVPFPVGDSNDACKKITELAKHMMTGRFVGRERRNLLSEIDKQVAIFYGVM